MRPDQILSVVPDVGSKPSTSERFIQFAKVICDAVASEPDVALDVSRRLDAAGEMNLARSFRVISDRARYRSTQKEQPR